MANFFTYGFMGFFGYVVVFVAAGGNASKAGYMVAQLVDISLDASVAALLSLIPV